MGSDTESTGAEKPSLPKLLASLALGARAVNALPIARENENNNDAFDIDQSSLTLVTCYPFDSVLPNPIHRYVVKAIAI